MSGFHFTHEAPGQCLTPTVLHKSQSGWRPLLSLKPLDFRRCHPLLPPPLPRVSLCPCSPGRLGACARSPRVPCSGEESGGGTTGSWQRLGKPRPSPEEGQLCSIPPDGRAAVGRAPRPLSTAPSAVRRARAPQVLRALAHLLPQSPQPRWDPQADALGEGGARRSL